MMCEACGRTKVVVLINPIRNPRSRAGRSGKVKGIAGHTLCRRCWRALIEPILAAQHQARIEARRAGEHAA